MGARAVGIPSAQVLYLRATRLLRYHSCGQPQNFLQGNVGTAHFLAPEGSVDRDRLLLPRIFGHLQGIEYGEAHKEEVLRFLLCIYCKKYVTEHIRRLLTILSKMISYGYLDRC